jgi:protease II
VEWLIDSNAVVYTVPDKLRRPCKVFLHMLDTNSKSDKLLFKEDNDKFFVDILCTKDKVCF